MKRARWSRGREAGRREDMKGEPVHVEVDEVKMGAKVVMSQRASGGGRGRMERGPVQRSPL